jgi:AraC family transcriptional regulator of adaptative response/methylated-DNA-[protein]-cysteine methyltransferase
MHATRFGACLLGVSPRGITHLAFAADRSEKALVRELAREWPEARLVRDERGTAAIAAEIFAPERKKNLSLFLKGTSFQLKVWEALLRIPPGHRLSYGDIAARVGNPGASRAVGTAVGSNPIGYLIPCHRVIRETGVIGEYRWGTPRKRAILAYESEAGMVSPLEPSPHAI